MSISDPFAVEMTTFRVNGPVISAEITDPDPLTLKLTVILRSSLPRRETGSPTWNIWLGPTMSYLDFPNQHLPNILSNNKVLAP